MSEERTRMGRQAKSVQKEENLSPLGACYFVGIGINEYEHWPPLKNAVRDISAVANLLKTEYGFSQENMRLLFNKEATEGNIIGLLEDLANQVKPTDSVLVYYAGHGHLNDRGRGFWVPVDAPEGSVFRYIRNSTIKDYIGDIKSLHTLLISDSCFSGSLFSGAERSSQLAADELSRLPSRWAICSGRHDEAVADGPQDGNSPFAESIMDVLQHNQRPVITSGFLVSQVIDQTRSNYDQLPDGGPLQNVGHKRGQFVFRRQGKEGINKQWKEIQEAVDNTLSEIRTKKKLIRQFITDYPDNDHTKAALMLGRQMEQKKAMLDAWDSEFGLIAFLRQDSPYREEAQARLQQLQEGMQTKKSFAAPIAEPTPKKVEASPEPKITKEITTKEPVKTTKEKSAKEVAKTTIEDKPTETAKEKPLVSTTGVAGSFAEIASSIKMNLVYVVLVLIMYLIYRHLSPEVLYNDEAGPTQLNRVILWILTVIVAFQSYKVAQKTVNYKAPILMFLVLTLLDIVLTTVLSFEYLADMGIGFFFTNMAYLFAYCLPGIITVYVLKKRQLEAV